MTTICRFQTPLASDVRDIFEKVSLSSRCVSGGLEQEEPGGQASGEPKWCVTGAETPSCPVRLAKTQRQAEAGESPTVKSLLSLVRL